MKITTKIEILQAKFICCFAVIHPLTLSQRVKKRGKYKKTTTITVR
jgi:hypothetical protein